MMAALSIIAIIYGAYMALAQVDLKKLIAYSSVSHMGFVTLGLFVLNQQGIEGAVMQMVNHGITTGALFLCVGMIYERTHSRLIADNVGLAAPMPRYATFLVIFALSLSACPAPTVLSANFWCSLARFCGARSRPPLPRWASFWPRPICSGWCNGWCSASPPHELPTQGPQPTGDRHTDTTRRLRLLDRALSESARHSHASERDQHD